MRAASALAHRRRRSVEHVGRQRRERTNHIRHALYVDDTLSVEVEDGVVRLLAREHGLAVPVQCPSLRLSMKGQRFYQLPDDAGQIPLQVRRVPPFDDVIGHEGHVVVNEHSRPEANSNGETAVMTITQSRRYPHSRRGCCEGR